MNIKHDIIVIDNINDRAEILSTLRSMYTDEDFNGNNGEEYTWESAIDEGFSSSQDYLVSELSKADFNGIRLVEEFIHEWLDTDGYYGDVSIVSKELNGGAVISYAVTEGD